jgi:hypothetical protein
LVAGTLPILPGFILNLNHYIMKTIFVERLVAALKLATIAILLTFVLFTGCKKGDPGIAGVPGATGPTGAQGPVGPAGADGSVILSGAGAPAANLGKVGDFYLNKTNSDFYGPKTATGWGTPFLLKGATGSNGSNGTNGATGASGKTILSGTVAPAAALGTIGDFYLNTTTYDFYGPKTAAGWGSPFNLRGNANVKSGTFTLTNADYTNGYWAVTTGSGSALGVSSRTAVKNIPGITTAIFNTGTVLIYLNVPQGLSSTPAAWSGLPFSIRGFNVGYMTSIRSNYDVGKIHVFYMFELTDAALASPPSIIDYAVPEYTFKYVLIAGDADARTSVPPVDYNDYEAVRKYYRLAD